ncbi:family 1 glycosylhydrolase [Aestuariivirga sp.]|uniref:family 1 glycosylhydrolase n=1 Tax=Aestuariivirga sp. TaxID=2650926 RepID=UPI003BABFE1F
MSNVRAIRPELWGGLECSIIRVGDEYRNQFEETGHNQSLGDLDRVAALGIKTLRYPVLWETVSPHSPESCNWAFPDERLGRLRELGINPIAGLLHHGSGPLYTSLMDPQFPALLAQHAARVAERYPWINLYTPVNEPLTTARFSGLYGHWYPHAHEERSFLRCLVNQSLGTVLAMRAVRHVNPAARLVQTEDLGKVFSTPRLRQQADYENERRWLSFDLLCGRVGKHHPWYQTLLRSGITGGELELLESGEGTPDILGINYYATSERYLDEDIHRYPPWFHGGNGRERYADVEALRVDLAEGETGAKARLAEAWARYGLPLAITEVHLGSTREEQLRWLAEVWQDACDLSAQGVDVRAVTTWSMLGALDWNSLLTQRSGFYETGAFDIRGPDVRLTAVGKALRQLTRSGQFDHPVLDEKGWWRREGRHYHSPARRAPAVLKRKRMILIAGASGKLGRELVHACHHRGLDIVCPSHHELDIGNPAQVGAAMVRYRPWAVINAAAHAGTETDSRTDRLFATNALGPENLARACAVNASQFLTFSSGQVFDGGLERPYVEGDRTCPTGLIGLSKVEAERRVARANHDALIIRMSGLFGSEDNPQDLFERFLQQADERMFFTATYMPDVVRTALDLLIDGERGTWHLANSGALSQREFQRIFPVDGNFTAGAEPLVLLGTERARLMPALADALIRQKDLLTARNPALSIAAE